MSDTCTGISGGTSNGACVSTKFQEKRWGFFLGTRPVGLGLLSYSYFPFAQEKKPRCGQPTTAASSIVPGEVRGLPWAFYLAITRPGWNDSTRLLGRIIFFLLANSSAPFFLGFVFFRGDALGIIYQRIIRGSITVIPSCRQSVLSANGRELRELGRRRFERKHLCQMFTIPCCDNPSVGAH